MTETIPTSRPVDWEGWDFLREFQATCGANAAAHGFRQEGIAVNELASRLRAEGNDTLASSIVSSYASKRMNLIHDELSEGHDELRAGRLMDEAYENTTPGKEGKPEGVPSELADVVIRAFDVADEFGIDLADVLFGKGDFNSKREAMHGKKF